MADSSPSSPRRLDSWKQIAAYLGRDVRTAMRWAKTDGLPVRRVAGGRGRSVFAYADEIDAWLAGPHPDLATTIIAGASAAADPVVSQPESPARRWLRARWHTVAALFVAGLIAAGVGAPLIVRAWHSWASDPALFLFDGNTLVSRERSGRMHTLFVWPDFEIKPLRPPDRVIVGGQPMILATIAAREPAHAGDAAGGEIVALTETGSLRWRFAFTETLRFNNQFFNAPWVIDGWAIDPGRPRLVVVAHHWHQWPSVASIVDLRDGRRVSTFVNSGWIESWQWIGGDRLLVGGISNARHGAMLAMLDARALDSHSPEQAGSEFACDNCGTGAPIRYFVFPQSEINREFSRRFTSVVAVNQMANRNMVTTAELHPGDFEINASVGALYELSQTFEPVSAAYSDEYWAWHRRLEEEGKVRHTRQESPDRDGPRSVEVWEPAGGWRTVTFR